MGVVVVVVVVDNAVVALCLTLIGYKKAWGRDLKKYGRPSEERKR